MDGEAGGGDVVIDVLDVRVWPEMETLATRAACVGEVGDVALGLEGVVGRCEVDADAA